MTNLLLKMKSIIIFIKKFRVYKPINSAVLILLCLE